MKKIILGTLMLGSFTAFAEDITYCQCFLIRATTSISSDGGSSAQVNLYLMKSLDGQVGRLSTLGNYFGQSQNRNWQKAVDRAQEKCEIAIEKHKACR